MFDDPASSTAFCVFTIQDFSFDLMSCRPFYPRPLKTFISRKECFMSFRFITLCIMYWPLLLNEILETEHIDTRGFLHRKWHDEAFFRNFFFDLRH